MKSCVRKVGFGILGMDFKALKWQILRGSLAKRLFVRALLFTLAMVIISFVQMGNDIRKGELVLLESGDCGLDVVVSDSDVNVTGFWKPVFVTVFGFLGGSARKKESKDLSRSVFKELMGKKMLDTRARALCVGEGSDLNALLLQEMGLSDALGVRSHPFFSLWKKRFVHELGFEDNYFDFVFSRDLDRVSVPALLVLEIERVLRPGGIGAMLIGMSNFYSGSSVRSSTPVSSFLKSSNIVSICGIGFTLVTFKKRFDNVALFEHYRLPDKCPSITKNKPFMKYIEPLAVNQLGHLESEISYISKFRNISSRKRVVYINVGAGELVNSSITEILEPNYHVPLQALDMYILDHNASALSLYVQKAGITFVYHPYLVGYTVPGLVSDEELSAPREVDEFEFIRWFKETITEGDFVVLMMTARTAELKIVFELFESGAICHVDELFLECSDTSDCKDSVCGDCRSLFRGLRNGGVYSHQWWEPETLF